MMPVFKNYLSWRSTAALGDQEEDFPPGLVEGPTVSSSATSSMCSVAAPLKSGRKDSVIVLSTAAAEAAAGISSPWRGKSSGLPPVRGAVRIHPLASFNSQEGGIPAIEHSMAHR